LLPRVFIACEEEKRRKDGKKKERGETVKMEEIRKRNEGLD